MPYSFKGGEKSKPTTWKQKQRVFAMSGLRHLRAPSVILALVAMMFSNNSLNFNSPIDHLELFAGECSISKGEWKEKRNGVPMDLRFGEDQDIMTDVGFSNMLYQTLNLRPGGALWAAPVCSSWIYLSRGSTFRSSSNPMGSNQGTCGLHNIMVARLIILLVICMAKKVWWCLEQPRGSLLEGHVLFQRMLQLPLVVVERVTCCLGHFGGDSMKPIWVYSSEPEAVEFNDYADRSLHPPNPNMVRRYTDGQGQQRITGGKALRASQAYPRRFGRAVARVRTIHLKRHQRDAYQFLRFAMAGDGSANMDPNESRFWVEQANLQRIFGFLSKQ